MRYSAVVISPHLDDAVFTCADQMMQHAKEGPVLVINIFTKFKEAVKDKAIVISDDRFIEEREASHFLKFTSHNLNELEAYFRRPEYHALQPIFQPVSDSDLHEYLDHLRHRIFSHLEQFTFDRLYVPLGSGWHVDHILTFKVFEPWIGKREIIFYEDVPYTFIPHALRYRLRDLGDYTPPLHDLTLRPHNAVISSLIAAGAYFNMAMMINLKPPIMRWVGTPVVCWYFLKLMVWHTQRRAYTGPRYMLTPVIYKTEDFSHKLEALSQYWGQFTEFFLDPLDCKKHFVSYARKVTEKDDPIERYWKLEPLE
jgi:LmbE family N-acetylglucosaminyl deacetylase